MRREDKLIDEKEIQKKIQETQAKLSGGGGRGKGLKAKLRREKGRNWQMPRVIQLMTTNYR